MSQKHRDDDKAPLFVPLDQWQVKAVAAYQRARVLILLGGPGSGKTHVAVGCALASVAMKQYVRIILSRPTAECGPPLGLLPGGVDDKMGPWMGPIRDVLENMSWLKFEDFDFEVVPLQLIRGRTAQRSVAILDEAQNATYEQLTAFLTRLKSSGKLVLAGDPDFQSDIGVSPLLEVVNDLKGLDEVEIVRLCGQHRDPLVTKMMKRLSKKGRRC